MNDDLRQEIEQCFLGCLLVSDIAYNEHTPRIRHEYFYNPAHARIFEATRKRYDTGKPVSNTLIIKRKSMNMTFITSSHDKNNLPSVALEYATQGKAIFPLLPHGKTPLTPHGLKDASTDAGIISTWWQYWPKANIGIPTGEINNFWALDIDTRHDGENSLLALEQKYGSLPQTTEIITGGGGRHLYFQYPQQCVISNSAGRLGLGLDVRGNGGYVVAPPSVHESGRGYEFSVDSADNISAAPEWLLDLVINPPDAPKGASVIDWRELVKGVAEGQRNDSLARIAGKLLWCGLDVFVSLELCLAWNDSRCKPPLDHDEVIAIVNSITGRELVRRGV